MRALGASSFVLLTTVAVVCGCRPPVPLPAPPSPELNCRLPAAAPFDAGPLPEPGLSPVVVPELPSLCGFPAPAMRRLNRAEYDNTVRDLLGVDLRLARDLPPDPLGAGFDNMAALLSLSPLLLEKLEENTRKLLDAALARNVTPPASTLYEAEDYPSGSGYADNAWWVLNGRDPLRVPVTLPAAGAYTLRVRAYSVTPGGAPPTLTVSLGEERVGGALITSTRESPALYEVRAQAAAAGDVVIQLHFADASRDREVALDWLEVDGPYDAPQGADPPPRRRLLTCTLEELGAEACARQIWGDFAARAWRRPVAPSEMAPYLAFLAAAAETPREGASADEVFEEGIKLGLSAILLSPQFLFRLERDPHPDVSPAHPLTDHELAQRLSYFLWSSTPDERLLAIADLGSLKHPAVLESEVRRMLRDDKARALTDNLAAQWLELRALDDLRRPLEAFPTFDGELRLNMQCETKLVFHEVLTTGGSLRELIDADFTWVTERLAGHYGIDGVEGDGWHRVSLEGTGRRGLLTHGSVLTLTSLPTRTSPVKRGKWVLDNLLCMPPDPPPPGVEGLSDGDTDAPQTLRAQLEQHRRDPACASCHEVMDPLGFALEGFDAIGARRSSTEGLPIDTSGVFPTGEPFDGPLQLAALLRGSPEVASCAAEKALTYALGRELDVVDACLMQDVSDRIQEGASLADLFVLIATHPAFQVREPMSLALDPGPSGASVEEGQP